MGKGIVIALALVGSIAWADQIQVVKQIELVGWTELNMPDGQTQTMALNRAGTRAYWLACSPPTGLTSFITPIGFPAPLLETQVVPGPNGGMVKKPGSTERTVAYKFTSFAACVVQRATSLGTAKHARVLLTIQKNTPILGKIGVFGFELKVLE